MSSFRYIAILGRQPELGRLELESVVGAEAVQPWGAVAGLTVPVVLERLGGTVKLAEVIWQGEAQSLRSAVLAVGDLTVGGSKTPFAVSAYGMRVTPRDVLAAGLELKRQLRKRGSVRLVTPARGLAVTAAELRHNRVLEDGFELVVARHQNQMVVARTLAVQDIDWYSRRDYDRPARSARVGMLPPKLAQVLLNTTQAPLVADPFCGTGVVLAEALLLGREAVGFDVAPDMVTATQTNLTWLEGAVSAPLPAWRAELADARYGQLPQGAAVVTEGYLGPNLSTSPSPEAAARFQAEVKALYRAALANWASQLPRGAEVSLCVPAWRVGRTWHYLGLVDELADLGYTLKGFQHAPNPLLYARDDQVVGRQLLILRKK